jgi:hypothetical protein
VVEIFAEFMDDKYSMVVGSAPGIEIDLFEDAEGFAIEGEIDGEVGGDGEDVLGVGVREKGVGDGSRGAEGSGIGKGGGGGVK